MSSIFNHIVISEPLLLNGFQVYQHMKFYIRPFDNKVCMFIDHGDGSGYLNDRINEWDSVSPVPLMLQPHMRLIMGCS